MKQTKNIISFIVIIIILFGIIFLFGCNKQEEAKSITDQQLDKLNFNWTATSVTLDNVPKDDTYGDFKIIYSGGQGSKTFGYTTEGRPALSPWPASGSFTFGDNAAATTLVREDQVVVTYEVTESSLTLKFNYSTPGYTGRVSAVKGYWEFEFTR